MPTLFDPITVGKFELANRVAMAPLTRMRSDADGVPKDMNVEYYSQRASAGLVVTEGTFPAVTSRGFWGQAGIETAEQLAFLRRHRCDVGQGYLFDRPIPGAELMQKLKRYPRGPIA